MINISAKNIPKQGRSKYFQNQGNTVVSGGGSNINSGGSGSSGLPYSTDENGNYVINNKTIFPEL